MKRKPLDIGLRYQYLHRKRIYGTAKYAASTSDIYIPHDSAMSLVRIEKLSFKSVPAQVPKDSPERTLRYP